MLMNRLIKKPIFWLWLATWLTLGWLILSSRHAAVWLMPVLV